MMEWSTGLLDENKIESYPDKVKLKRIETNENRETMSGFRGNNCLNKHMINREIKENGNTDRSTSEIEHKHIQEKQDSCLWE